MLCLFFFLFFTHNAITLTTQHSTCSSSSIGRAFFIYPVRFLDPQTNSTVSFSCHFSFSILSSPSCPSRDGLSFLIASSTPFSTLSSGYMGLPSPQRSSLSFFAVEFDTAFYPSLGDINDNHVAVDVNSLASFASTNAAMVRVWAGYSSTRPPTPILAAQIDLSERLEDFMHVGFTASNGEGSSVHLVHHWQFKTFGYDSPSMYVVEEGDCFLCYEGDSTEEEKDWGNGSWVGRVDSVCGVWFGGNDCGTSKMPTRLSLSDIKSATMGFNRDRLVGEGASAKVYKGFLPFRGDVAVKRFERENDLDCLHNPFATEFATIVSYLRNKNLVQLKGWCCEGNELVLVYEFLPNGSLNKVLHRNFNSSIVLSWQQRVNIVLGVASALTYLHEECERQIIHRDGQWGILPLNMFILVLEVATGRKPVEDGGTVVADFVWGLWEKRKLIEAADPRLMGKFDELEMESSPLPLLPTSKPRVRSRPICPDDDTSDAQSVVADLPSTDEAPYLTPRNQFY
ncbi:hypothetical protein GYH30_056083 [Glycine max]|uniref:Protein kinase domain-containing protein n=1 Tax=Glycine max TaxID=3847 RepID=A0A0R0EC29_SOYBN|nr:hypothetical protein GYH30_056083 [Glycine max]